MYKIAGWLPTTFILHSIANSIRSTTVLFTELGGIGRAGDTKRAFPETYRDVWTDTKLISEAAKEAQRIGVPVEVAAA